MRANKVALTPSNQDLARKGTGPAARPLSWHRRVHGEPDLADVLGDPIVHLVMGRDGVAPEELTALIERARCGLRRRVCQDFPLAA
jgi:hypothetical protein